MMGRVCTLQGISFYARKVNVVRSRLKCRTWEYFCTNVVNFCRMCPVAVLSSSFYSIKKPIERQAKIHLVKLSLQPDTKHRLGATSTSRASYILIFYYWQILVNIFSLSFTGFYEIFSMKKHEKISFQDESKILYTCLFIYKSFLAHIHYSDHHAKNMQKFLCEMIFIRHSVLCLNSAIFNSFYSELLKFLIKKLQIQ